MTLTLFLLISHILLVLSLGWYLATNLQWYSYKIERVILHHTKYHWHIIYFLIPLFAYYFTDIYFWIYFYFAYLPSLWLWNKKLDKKLVVTGRIKRFFALLLMLTVFQDILCLAKEACQVFGVILPLTMTVIGSMMIEKVLFHGFKIKAKEKLKKMDNLIIIGVTASYGKTSIKNFIAQILGNERKVYATPRSVNTLGGVMKDINDDLPEDTEVYIVEMGARGPGDIAEITEFVQPHYAVVGVIGPQHIEYFKTLERIRNTKMEILSSKRLEHAWVHTSAHVKPYEKVTIFGDEIKNIKATLEGVDFELVLPQGTFHLHIPILGKFNAINVTAALHVANALGISYEKAVTYAKTLQPVEHRLQRIEANGKVILDDSFNGNIDGMLNSFELASQHSGRKVLVTPGLVESDIELNEKVAKKANEIFDLIIVTGKINQETFKKIVDNEKLHTLNDKSKMQELLAEMTKPGDLILFANDAPNFI
ncbi:UDP-N-acetylmuramoyl-tripeptide--D-alanyl-D-alanine ligase [Hydrogenimonas thermophila]|uniref:UDP-N-acetylmuramoyl-tripeptide--D-alanyl-D- alanine ligase n=1 Tax=Hydrogenimonas thermophila TaxID=223786 RepID=UPI00293703CC|nr:UDP-N-acetylmuramoyl-tripeptide--D-alanyl-D-alanine ligase [Hydrogenimonas thermophila]WOE68795.1 UDP-N-acetylmuramoyl-tripeptide--D-alanyl-D-alanine ligase [Hydrogenimonas thermophila]WOE71305.1 UDP-N-acetylmuramoyl-tripeptide--D-alanyl-D-alanine ligase [Hydrogenimonas thermophila]